MATEFTTQIILLIRRIPEGKVCTYGLLAAAAGSPRGARQVSRILHSCSQKEGLPWHRVVNRNGQISLKPGSGYEIQKQLLEGEGVVFEDDTIDLKRYLWWPDGAVPSGV